MRKSRGSLSKQSRIDYTNAVQCLQQKSPVSPLSEVPGARSRFDDFSAGHIIQSPYVHFSVRIILFLSFLFFCTSFRSDEEGGGAGRVGLGKTLLWRETRKKEEEKKTPPELKIESHLFEILILKKFKKK